MPPKKTGKKEKYIKEIEKTEKTIQDLGKCDEHETPENILKLAYKDGKYESPIDLSLKGTRRVSLPNIEWFKMENEPKQMKITNSGTTAILTGKWFGPRPYISGGPLTGNYEFSQLHFHWGASDEEGSEHTLESTSMPLEMHAMFFKQVYNSQKEALKEVDGIVVIAYLYQLQVQSNERIVNIVDSLASIRKPLVCEQLKALPLENCIPCFTDDYLLYWGKLPKEECEHAVLWFICRYPCGISHNQLEEFRKIISLEGKPINRNYRPTRSHNGRTIFHVRPSTYTKSFLLPVPHEIDSGNNRISRQPNALSSSKTAKKGKVKGYLDGRFSQFRYGISSYGSFNGILRKSSSSSLSGIIENKNGEYEGKQGLKRLVYVIANLLNSNTDNESLENLKKQLGQALKEVERRQMYPDQSIDTFKGTLKSTNNFQERQDPKSKIPQISNEENINLPITSKTTALIESDTKCEFDGGSGKKLGNNALIEVCREVSIRTLLRTKISDLYSKIGSSTTSEQDEEESDDSGKMKKLDTKNDKGNFTDSLCYDREHTMKPCTTTPNDVTCHRPQPKSHFANAHSFKGTSPSPEFPRRNNPINPNELIDKGENIKVLRSRRKMKYLLEEGRNSQTASVEVKPLKDNSEKKFNFNRGSENNLKVFDISQRKLTQRNDLGSHTVPFSVGDNNIEDSSAPKKGKFRKKEKGDSMGNRPTKLEVPQSRNFGSEPPTVKRDILDTREIATKNYYQRTSHSNHKHSSNRLEQGAELIATKAGPVQESHGKLEGRAGRVSRDANTQELVNTSRSNLLNKTVTHFGETESARNDADVVELAPHRTNSRRSNPKAHSPQLKPGAVVSTRDVTDTERCKSFKRNSPGGISHKVNHSQNLSSREDEIKPPVTFSPKKQYGRTSSVDHTKIEVQNMLMDPDYTQASNCSFKPHSRKSVLKPRLQFTNGGSQNNRKSTSNSEVITLPRSGIQTSSFKNYRVNSRINRDAPEPTSVPKHNSVEVNPSHVSDYQRSNVKKDNSHPRLTETRNSFHGNRLSSHKIQPPQSPVGSHSESLKRLPRKFSPRKVSETGKSQMWRY